MHWEVNKSIGYGDEIGRHLADRYGTDTDGLLHAGKMAWRALEFLQRLLVEGWPDKMSRAEIEERVKEAMREAINFVDDGDCNAGLAALDLEKPITINEEAHGVNDIDMPF